MKLRSESSPSIVLSAALILFIGAAGLWPVVPTASASSAADKVDAAKQARLEKGG